MASATWAASRSPGAMGRACTAWMVRMVACGSGRGSARPGDRRKKCSSARMGRSGRGYAGGCRRACSRRPPRAERVGRRARRRAPRRWVLQAPFSSRCPSGLCARTLRWPAVKMIPTSFPPPFGIIFTFHQTHTRPSALRLDRLCVARRHPAHRHKRGDPRHHTPTHGTHGSLSPCARADGLDHGYIPSLSCTL